MAYKLYLHIGAQKTGTTSIQAALSDNRLLLAEHGIEYPETEIDDPNSVSHYNSFRGFFAERTDQRASTMRFVERVSAMESDIILSAECLSAWPSRRRGQKLHELWAVKKKIIADIKKSFPNHETTVILYTRNVPEFLQSLYGTHLKASKRPDTPEEYDRFLSKEAHLADFASEIAAWRSSFDTVTVVDYHRITSSVETFCEIVGLPSLPDRRENVSAQADAASRPGTAGQ